MFEPAPYRRLLPLAAVLVGLAVPHSAAADKPDVRLDVHGQVRHIVAGAVDDPATGDDESALPTRNELLLRRLRLGAKAKRGDVRARLLFAVDRGKPRLLTGTLRWKLRRGLDLELGQHKRLLSQGYLDSSKHQRLPERAELHDDFGGNRDIGLSLRIRPTRRLDLRLAVWNGAGANVVGNDTGRLWVEGRGTLRLGSRFSTEDARIGKRFAALLGLAGVSGRKSAVRSDKNGLLTRADDHLGASAFLALRWRRVEARFEVLWSSDTPVDARNDTSTAFGLTATSQLGAVAQIAWQPFATVELVARYAHHDVDRDDPDRWGRVLEAGVGWRPDKDDARKLQVAVQQEQDGRKGGQTYDRLRLLTQLQWSF
ncbi:MAG: hypothetical protein RIT45_3179 [Pseudomonadota bacterium]